MVFRNLCVSALLGGALVAAAPVHATYANDGYDYDYSTGQLTGWWRGYVNNNVWNEYAYGTDGQWHFYWQRDFNTDWVSVYGGGAMQVWIGYYRGRPNDLYVAYNNGWIPSAQYLALLQAAVQQQQGGITLSIGGTEMYYENAGANFGSFLDYVSTYGPPLAPGPWTRRAGQSG